MHFEKATLHTAACQIRLSHRLLCAFASKTLFELEIAFAILLIAARRSSPSLSPLFAIVCTSPFNIDLHR